jgi:hypothetical protein
VLICSRILNYLLLSQNQTVMAKDYHSMQLCREYEYPFQESEKAERFILKESVGIDKPKWADDQREQLR